MLRRTALKVNPSTSIAKANNKKHLQSKGLYQSESSFRIFIKSYNYAEGVKPLITPNAIGGKVANRYRNARRD